MTAPTFTEHTTPADIIGLAVECSFDVDGAPKGRYPYRPCGRVPVVATWYAVRLHSSRREPIAVLCAIHDRHAQRAVDGLPFSQRMYEREGI